ncbi:MAG TPA: M13 family metallopeptidase [Nevskiaceae bacterium]|nr:M13 family metallopeptidase [Nevskiaceae bacterium]
MTQLRILATACVLLAACSQPQPPAAAPSPVAAPPAAPAPVAGVSRSDGDPAVRAQDDFYRAVNGGWYDRTEIPPEKAEYGSFDIVFDDTERQLRELVETAASAHGAAGAEAQKVGDLYASYMDQARVEELGLKPVQPELERIDAIKDKAELPALMAHLQRIGVALPFNTVVHQDNKDATRYIVDFQQSGLGMPDRDYFLDQNPKFAQLRKDYLAHIEKMLALSGAKDIEAGARGVLAFETALAGKQWDNVSTRDPLKVYNLLDAAKFKALMPGYGWDAYLKDAGIAVDSMVVSEPSYLAALDRILRDTPLPVLKNYFKLRLLDGSALVLNQQVYDEAFDFNRAKLYGVKAQKPRWKRGIKLVDASIGEALGKIYVEKYFPPANKARMEQLVANLLKAYDQEFDTLAWMSDDTRRRAKAKLAKFMPKIGYPKKFRDYSALVIARGDLYGNFVRANEFEYQREIGKLGRPVDRDEWGMTPQTINAYYNPELNEIVFPAAILKPPFFDMAADDAVNYGGIGAVIGHEISHGFDDQGSLYDGDGNLQDWWTPEDRRKFQEQTRALIAQYDQYEVVKGFHVKGALTIGENIADLGGITIAYKAYQISLGGKPAPVIDGLSGDQRFFMGYAQIWREKLRDEAAINLVKSDPHSPGRFRCNGVVINVPEFYSTFDVKPGDKMYSPPEKRVKIW